MKFIHSKSPKNGIRDMAHTICNALNDDKKVLWLVSGGSNISIAVEAMNMIHDHINKLAVDADEKFIKLKNLTVTLTDERFGLVGHKDSNWQQLQDAGFNFDNISIIPVLGGNSLEKTADDFSKNVRNVFDNVDIIVGQFGIGSDGHIAGILPNSIAVNEKDMVSSYVATIYTRITLTPTALQNVSIAYVFVYGETKRETMKNLYTKDMAISIQPAAILKSIKEVYIYSDVI